MTSLATEPVDDFTKPLPQAADRHAHWMHIVVSRGKFARSVSTPGQNVRLEIWLAGWRIAILTNSAGNPVVSERDGELRNGIHFTGTTSTE